MGVLHKGLKGQLGHQAGLIPLGHVHLAGKPVPESNGLDVHIPIHQLQLLPYGGVLADLLHIVPEEIGHIFHEKTGLVRSLHHGKLRPCIQAVKQKMRVNLCLKIFKLRFF